MNPSRMSSVPPRQDLRSTPRISTKIYCICFLSPKGVERGGAGLRDHEPLRSRFFFLLKPSLIDSFSFLILH